MCDWRRQWPVVPTFSYGGMNYGKVTKPTSLNGAMPNGAGG